MHSSLEVSHKIFVSNVSDTLELVVCCVSHKQVIAFKVIKYSKSLLLFWIVF
eukprot:04194.XXX_205229_205384_1 [CDS] Oithona nana genome sequencing.